MLYQLSYLDHRASTVGFEPTAAGILADPTTLVRCIRSKRASTRPDLDRSSTSKHDGYITATGGKASRSGGDRAVVRRTRAATWCS